MKIAILGVGNIGATIARRLASAGHDVKVANSRGPETIPIDVLATGAHAVHAQDVTADADALILSIPLAAIPDIKSLVDELPTNATVLDTSNYYPFRDGDIAALEDGQVESLWVAEQLGRPIVKAWNAIGTHSFDTLAQADGPGRVAIPVAADADADRALGMKLVQQTGFDAYNSGTLADSWRQQPGAPAYCTDLTHDEMGRALAAADRTRLPKRRDLMVHVITALADDPTTSSDFLVRVNRLLSE